MKLINLTNSDLNIIGTDKVKTSGTVCRLSLIGTEWVVNDLPDPETGVIYIVSNLVATRIPDRTDVYIPGGVVYNSEGLPVGHDGLICSTAVSPN